MVRPSKSEIRFIVRGCPSDARAKWAMTSTPSRDRIDGIATAGSGKKSEKQIINKL
jgi:hypothetical protein